MPSRCDTISTDFYILSKFRRKPMFCVQALILHQIHVENLPKNYRCLFLKLFMPAILRTAVGGQFYTLVLPLKNTFHFSDFKTLYRMKATDVYTIFWVFPIDLDKNYYIQLFPERDTPMLLRNPTDKIPNKTQKTGFFRFWRASFCDYRPFNTCTVADYQLSIRPINSGLFPPHFDTVEP